MPPSAYWKGQQGKTCRRASIITHLPGPNQGQTTSETTPANQPESPQDSLARGFMMLLDQIRNLKDGEFKVLAALTGLFATEPGNAGGISARDLAEATNLGRRTIQSSIDSLTHKHLLAATPGSGPKPPTFHLRFLETKKISGANFAPVAVEKVAEIHNWLAQKMRQYHATGANSAPQEDLFQQPSGADSAPVTGPSGANFAPVEAPKGEPAGARVESKEPDLKPDIDRGERQQAKPEDENTILNHVLTAKPRDWEPREIREARKWVQGYQCGMGDKFHASPERNRNPPDDQILAQILTAAGSLAKTINLIHTLKARQKPPGDEYSWYVTTALNIYHGIAPRTTKAARAQLKLARRPDPAEIAGEQLQLSDAATAAALDADPQFRNELLRDIARTRRARGANRR